MRKPAVIYAFIVISFCSIRPSFAADEGVKDKAAPAAQAPKAGVAATAAAESKSAAAATVSQADMEKYILDSLEKDKDIINIVPGFKKAVDPSGKISYTFEGSEIKDLDKEKLRKIYIRIRQERTRLHTERLMRQMEMVRQANHIAELSRQVSRVPVAASLPAQAPRTPPSNPRVYQVPRTPSGPPRQIRR